MIKFNEDIEGDFWLKLWIGLSFILFLIILTISYFDYKEAQENAKLIKAGFIQKPINYLHEGKNRVKWVWVKKN